MRIEFIIAGIALIILSKYSKCKDDEKVEYKCLMNYFESDIFMKISKFYGILFIMIGIINILTKETIIELYSFIISMVIAGMLVINTLIGLWRYIK